MTQQADCLISVQDSSVIANRLSQLESSQEKWKNRVGENEANMFTVQGRLERAGKINKGSTSSAESPGSPPKGSKVKSLGAKVIAPIRFRTKEASTTGGGSSSNANSPKEELPKQSVPVAEPIRRGSMKNQYSRKFYLMDKIILQEEGIDVCTTYDGSFERGGVVIGCFFRLGHYVQQ